MPDRTTIAELLLAGRAGRRPHRRRPSVPARVMARLRPVTYDRMLAVGVEPAPGSPLDAHERRVTSAAERRAIVCTLRRVRRHGRGGAPLERAMPLHSANVGAAAGLIDRLILRLQAPQPVCARGMARLRLVLADGSGPLYRGGRGDLAGAPITPITMFIRIPDPEPLTILPAIHPAIAPMMM